jgi:hypothetical protein
MCVIWEQPIHANHLVFTRIRCVYGFWSCNLWNSIVSLAKNVQDLIVYAPGWKVTSATVLLPKVFHSSHSVANGLVFLCLGQPHIKLHCSSLGGLVWSLTTECRMTPSSWTLHHTAFGCWWRTPSCTVQEFWH